MAQRGNLTNSGALSLHSLRQVAFSQNATANFAPLAASVVPVNLTVTESSATSKEGSFTYQLDMGAGKLPAWVQPGIAVRIIASVTISTVSYDVSGYYIIETVDSNGVYFQVRAPNPGRSNALTQTLTVTALDNGAGLQHNPAVNLITQFQKAMLVATTGSVIVAPSVDVNGNAPYSFTLTAGQAEYEISAPTGSKYDLADWQIKTNGSVIAVRFA